MRKLVVILFALLPLGAPVGAADGPVKVSLGYAYAKYLHEGLGSAPVGAYLSVSGNKSVTLEFDGGYQRDSEEDVVLNTFTATAGPRFAGRHGTAEPFFHLLGGLRHDRIEGSSNTSWGGMAGGGVDIKAGQRVAVRLGADFQIFWDQGENLRTLRLIAGLTF
jgi:hypothetical protein